MKKLHYERMDGKPKATQEGSFVETNLLVGKSTGFLTSPRNMNPSLLEELKLVLESKEGILPQGTFFLKSIEGSGRSRRTGRQRHGNGCVCLNPTRTGGRRQIGL